MPTLPRPTGISLGVSRLPPPLRRTFPISRASLMLSLPPSRPEPTHRRSARSQLLRPKALSRVAPKQMAMRRQKRVLTRTSRSRRRTRHEGAGAPTVAPSTVNNSRDSRLYAVPTLTST